MIANGAVTFEEITAQNLSATKVTRRDEDFDQEKMLLVKAEAWCSPVSYLM